jgi:hypothetical protein
VSDGAAEQLSFRGRRVPRAFRRREIALLPGGARAFDAEEWRDALVVVERGAVELESLNGARCLLECGAVAWLVGLPLRALHNAGVEPAVLVAVSRRGTPAMKSRPIGSLRTEHHEHDHAGWEAMRHVTTTTNRKRWGP